MKNPVKNSRFPFSLGLVNILPCKKRAWQSIWVLCISPRRDLLVHDPARHCEQVVHPCWRCRTLTL